MVVADEMSAVGSFVPIADFDDDSCVDWIVPVGKCLSEGGFPRRTVSGDVRGLFSHSPTLVGRAERGCFGTEFHARFDGSAATTTTSTTSMVVEGSGGRVSFLFIHIVVHDDWANHGSESGDGDSSLHTPGLGAGDPTFFQYAGGDVFPGSGDGSLRVAHLVG